MKKKITKKEIKWKAPKPMNGHHVIICKFILMLPAYSQTEFEALDEKAIDRRLKEDNVFWYTAMPSEDIETAEWRLCEYPDLVWFKLAADNILMFPLGIMIDQLLSPIYPVKTNELPDRGEFETNWWHHTEFFFKKLLSNKICAQQIDHLIELLDRPLQHELSGIYYENQREISPELILLFYLRSLKNIGLSKGGEPSQQDKERIISISTRPSEE